MTGAAFSLVKVGGSCIAKGVERVAAKVAAIGGKVVVIHGYSIRAREILAGVGVARREFVSSSGVHSHFTGDAELGAALLAASVEGVRLRDASAANGRAATAVLGHRGLLGGERKRALRYYVGKDLRVHRDDLSGKIAAVDLARVAERLATSDVLVVGALLSDPAAGPRVCEADAVASSFARAAELASYDIYSDVDGFVVDGAVLPEVSLARLEQLRAAATGGMSKKLRYIAEALEGGVRRVHLTNGLADGGASEKGTAFTCD